MKVFMETSEIAEQMGIGVRQVQKLAQQGRIPHVRRGRRIRVPADAWATFLAQQSAQALDSMKEGAASHAEAA